ncbi:MAG TPA: DUF456 domain-containing protein [Acidimicrobiia bacterium]
MNPFGEFLVGVVMLIGLAGIVLPVIPGLVLILAAVFVWALEESSTVAWGVFGVALLLAIAATVVKYLIPGRNLKEAGIPTSTLLVASLGAFIGFFAIPIVGAPVGFVIGIYLTEWRRVGRQRAWPATKTSAGQAALSIGIELAGGLLIFGIWFTAAVVA